MSSLESYLLDECQYIELRTLDDGNVIGVCQMITTYALAYGLDEFGLRGRYCYPDRMSASCALEDVTALDENNPPDDDQWIKHKGRGEDFSNPRR